MRVVAGQPQASSGRGIIAAGATAGGADKAAVRAGAELSHVGLGARRLMPTLFPVSILYFSGRARRRHADRPSGAAGLDRSK